MSARRFSDSQRAALWVAADGRCQADGCGRPLEPGWHADHVVPHVAGGPTDVVNGQALCPPCNLKKGSTMHPTLRPWQQDALESIHRTPDDFLVVATPGAGKTTLALTAAADMLSAGGFRQIVVVVPTSHLREQWARAAAVFGIQLDPTFTNGAAALAPDYDGTVVTYATVASSPQLWRRITSNAPTLVILDEIHHAGDTDHLSWGPALRQAFEHAARRLLLSGTPFRSDGHPIPFVEYDPTGRCVPGINYDYGRALEDGGVVRPIEFLALNSEVKWRNAGAVNSDDHYDGTWLDQADDDNLANALRAAFSPDGDWIPSVMTQADVELTRIRETMPDAGGLVIATDQTSARRYAKTLEQVCGEPVDVAVSDDRDASKTIHRFAKGTSRWLVAVKMVSEGVDIPRLAVGVYATTTRTEMFMRQVVGRFVRTRGDEDEISAVMFIPSIQPLLRFAADIERTVDAALAEHVEKTRQAAKDSAQTTMFDLVEPAGSSEATHHSTIRSGEFFDDAELHRAMELIQHAGIRSNISPAEAAALLRLAGSGRVAGTAVVDRGPDPKLRSDEKRAKRLEVKNAVNKYARLTDLEHAHIHKRLNDECGGPIKQATLDQLDRRIEILDRWTRGLA